MNSTVMFFDFCINLCIFIKLNTILNIICNEKSKKYYSKYSKYCTYYYFFTIQQISKCYNTI